MKNFGSNLRNLRESMRITREMLCDDESQLSVRQLARIETGVSLPNIGTALFIAAQLGVSLDALTRGEKLELPQRYKELKYLILRIPTYFDKLRIEEKESQFSEIFEKYYENLPEDEQVIIDGLQSKFEVYQTGNIDFGIDMLSEYFAQVKVKKDYKFNDLIIIDLYLTCLIVTDFSEELYNQEIFQTVQDNILKQSSTLELDNLFLLNQVILSCINISLKIKDNSRIEELLTSSHDIMTRIQDFQRMPVYFMYKWKNELQNYRSIDGAVDSYEQSKLFANIIGQGYLVEKLTDEWESDLVTFKSRV